MRLEIKVHPNASVERLGDGEAWVKAPPDKGKANAALVELLARHFSIPKSKVRILRGHSSRKKLVELDI